jgi:hypothetical protein
VDDNAGVIGIAVNVIGPAMQEDDGGTVGRAGFGKADAERAGVDVP